MCIQYFPATDWWAGGWKIGENALAAGFIASSRALMEVAWHVCVRVCVCVCVQDSDVDSSLQQLAAVTFNISAAAAAATPFGSLGTVTRSCWGLETQFCLHAEDFLVKTLFLEVRAPNLESTDRIVNTYFLESKLAIPAAPYGS